MGLQLGDRDAGRVRSDDDRRADERIDGAVGFGLDVDILGHVLDDQLGAIDGLGDGLRETHCARTGRRAP